jgi:hypothetical protein
MKLILIELNEINFDVVKEYINSGESLPSFNKIINNNLIETVAEIDYENLEPWIQWVSVHTGKKYSDHNIFRLGDIINSDIKQIFEQVEDLGYKVGAISPMNAKNNLRNPSFFIPDPWTKTDSDKSYLSKSITRSISQAVNDNTQSKLTFRTVVDIIYATLVLINPFKIITLAFYALSSIGKPWRKALFLDKLIHEFHKTLYRRKKPDFSTIFLNAGAHIQHHYFFNSPFIKDKSLSNPSWYIDDDQDPMLEMLISYDKIIKDYLEMKGVEIIIATGLSQKPYNKLKIYYRLNDHALFLNQVGINFQDITPRMTRDFLVTFADPSEALKAQEDLSSIMVNHKEKLFGYIDNRGIDLFVTLTYPYEITDKTTITFNDYKFLLKEHVSFVAIKNGMHDAKGYAFLSDGLDNPFPEKKTHVSNIHGVILNFFKNTYG